jgi:hypothetical protein
MKMSDVRDLTRVYMQLVAYFPELKSDVHTHHHLPLTLLALPTKAKGIVFRFIIEYNSSLRDFGPLGNTNRFMRIFERS